MKRTIKGKLTALLTIVEALCFCSQFIFVFYINVITEYAYKSFSEEMGVKLTSSNADSECVMTNTTSNSQNVRHRSSLEN